MSMSLIHIRFPSLAQFSNACDVGRTTVHMLLCWRNGLCTIGHAESPTCRHFPSYLATSRPRHWHLCARCASTWRGRDRAESDHGAAVGRQFDASARFGRSRHLTRAGLLQRRTAFSSQVLPTRCRPLPPRSRSSRVLHRTAASGRSHTYHRSNLRDQRNFPQPRG